MSKNRPKPVKETTPLDARYDSMSSATTGRGTSKDKLERLSPNAKSFHSMTMRQWYQSNGFIENIVDGPAEDAVREWITIKTNRDNDDEETGLPGLGINRLIMNRLDELAMRDKIYNLVRYSRMYAEGGFLYCGIISDKPQVYSELANPMPAIKKIDFINVFGPDYVSIMNSVTNPLSRYYDKRKYYISGIEVHNSRMWHLVRKYLPEERKGISLISTILDPVIAQDTALWSVSTLVYEMSIWIFKSPDMKTMPPEKLAETLANMKALISTQSCMGIAEDEELQRISGTEAGKGLFKEMFDFIMENLAGMAHMPKSRLMGQSQGVITSGQFDLRGYYESVAKSQEKDIRPILDWIIGLVIREQDGEISKLLYGDATALDWEIEFNPLWTEDSKEKADRELKEAQRDQIYITTGVLSPSEVKQMRFTKLEEFDEWENAPINFKTPEIQEPDETGENEAGKEKNEKEPDALKQAF